MEILKITKRIIIGIMFLIVVSAILMYLATNVMALYGASAGLNKSYAEEVGGKEDYNLNKDQIRWVTDETNKNIRAIVIFSGSLSKEPNYNYNGRLREILFLFIFRSLVR